MKANQKAIRYNQLLARNSNHFIVVTDIGVRQGRYASETRVAAFVCRGVPQGEIDRYVHREASEISLECWRKDVVHGHTFLGLGDWEKKYGGEVMTNCRDNVVETYHAICPDLGEYLNDHADTDYMLFEYVVNNPFVLCNEMPNVDEIYNIGLWYLVAAVLGLTP